MKAFKHGPEFTASCQKKVPLTRVDAMIEAARLNLVRADDRVVRAYRCQFGNHWHVGRSRLVARWKSSRGRTA